MKKNTSLSQKNTVTREFLAKALKREIGINGKHSAIIVDQIIDSLISSICKNNELSI